MYLYIRLEYLSRYNIIGIIKHIVSATYMYITITRSSPSGNLNGDIIFKEDSVKIGTCPKVREIKIIYKEESEKKP